MRVVIGIQAINPIGLANKGDEVLTLRELAVGTVIIANADANLAILGRRIARFRSQQHRRVVKVEIAGRAIRGVLINHHGAANYRIHLPAIDAARFFGSGIVDDVRIGKTQRPPSIAAAVDAQRINARAVGGLILRDLDALKGNVLGTRIQKDAATRVPARIAGNDAGLVVGPDIEYASRPNAATKGARRVARNLGALLHIDAHGRIQVEAAAVADFRSPGACGRVARNLRSRQGKLQLARRVNARARSRGVLAQLCAGCQVRNRDAL